MKLITDTGRQPRTTPYMHGLWCH